MFKFDLNPSKRYHLSQSDKIDVHATYNQYLHINNPLIHVFPSIYKPIGIWYAFGREWLDFNQNIDDCDLPPLYELDLNIGSIIHISSIQKAKTFHALYGNSDNTIDWVKVAAIWDGIEIKPFDKLCDFEWYKTFDLSSGCIWNLQTIKNITKLSLGIECDSLQY